MYEGRLVRLRALEPGDAERAHPWMHDLAVTDGLQRRYPFSTAEQRRWMEEHATPSFAQAQFAIETLDGVHIGGCGLFDGNPENRCAELGIAIGDRSYRGRGYGTDTVEVLCRFGFGEMNLHRIQLWVHADNPGAQRVYERAGFVVEGRAREAFYQHGQWIDLVLMSLVREE